MAGTTFLREFCLSVAVDISHSKKIRLKVDNPPIWQNILLSAYIWKKKVFKQYRETLVKNLISTDLNNDTNQKQKAVLHHTQQREIIVKIK